MVDNLGEFHPMDVIRKAIEDHEKLVHSELVTRPEIEEMDSKALLLIQEIADEILGPVRSSLYGPGVRDSAQGMKANQTQLLAWQKKVDARLSNGGLNAKLSSRDRATVTVAAISAIATVILGVIQFASG